MTQSLQTGNSQETLITGGAATRAHVLTCTRTIVRLVKNIDRELEGPRILRGDPFRTPYISSEDEALILEGWPMNMGLDEVELHYVLHQTSGDLITNQEIRRAYHDHELFPDPPAHAADVRSNPQFFDVIPTATLWQHNGIWHYVAFSTIQGTRYTNMGRNAAFWTGPWWLVGRKQGK